MGAYLVVVELSVDAHKAESGPDEGPLRSDVVQSRVGDHPGDFVIGGHGQQADNRLRGVAVAAGRGSQAVADLDRTTIWLALEADPPDCLPVGQASDPVVAERPLLSERYARAKEAPRCANVALEREIVRPRVGRSRTPSDDTFGLCDIDRVQLEARCSNIGHGGRESAPIAEQPGFGHDRGLPAEDGLRRAPEKTNTFGGRWPILPNYMEKTSAPTAGQGVPMTTTGAVDNAAMGRRPVNALITANHGEAFGLAMDLDLSHSRQHHRYRWPLDGAPPLPFAPAYVDLAGAARTETGAASGTGLVRRHLSQPRPRT